jgi:hypothetical protein
MFRFAKLDHLVLLVLGTSPCLGFDPCLLALGLILLHCNLLWTFLRASFYFVTGRSFTPRPCLVLTAPGTIKRYLRPVSPLFVRLSWSFYYLQGNRMVQFGLPDCPVFLPRVPLVLLLAETFVTTVPCMAVSMIKTSSWS